MTGLYQDGIAASSALLGKGKNCLAEEPNLAQREPQTFDLIVLSQETTKQQNSAKQESQ